MTVHPFDPGDLNLPGQDHAWTDPDRSRHIIADAALARAERELADAGHDVAAAIVTRLRAELAP
jgi:hypothetical protein